MSSLVMSANPTIGEHDVARILETLDEELKHCDIYILVDDKN